MLSRPEIALQLNLLRGTWFAVVAFMTTIILFGRQITVAGVEGDMIFDAFASIVVFVGVAAIISPCCDRLVQWWYRLAAFVLVTRMTGLLYLLISDSYDTKSVALQTVSYLVFLVVFMNSYLQWKLVTERAC